MAGQECHLAKTILLSYFEEVGLFQQLAPTLRLIDKAWFQAVNCRITRFRFSLSMLDCGGPTSLQHFPALKSLAFKKPSKGRGAVDLDTLEDATQLRSLSVDGLKVCDGYYLRRLLSLRQLTELRVNSDISFADPNRCQRGIVDMRHIESFVFHSRAPRLTPIADDVWNKMGNIQKLSLSIRAPYTSVGMFGIMQLPKLETLKLNVPMSPGDVEMLCSMPQLKALFLEDQHLPKQCQRSLSELTGLTRLQFVSSLIQLPMWLSSLTCLRCLKVSWNFSSHPGALLPKILPVSLTSLTLHNCRFLIQSTVLDPLTRLQTLDISYTCKKTTPNDRAIVQQLTNLTTLIIRRSVQSDPRPLPVVHHLSLLKRLFLEDTGIIEIDDVRLIASRLTELVELSLGSGLTDMHLRLISRISTLESFTLLHSPDWGCEGFEALCQLPKLRDLRLYYSGNYPIIQDSLTALKVQFRCLEHLGMFPAKHPTVQMHIPYLVQVTGTRVLIIDDDCKIHTLSTSHDPWEDI